MSIKTTYYISRQLAEKVINHQLEQLDDKEIADILEDLPQSTFRNYVICDGGNDDRRIDSMYDFMNFC